MRENKKERTDSKETKETKGKLQRNPFYCQGKDPTKKKIFLRYRSPFDKVVSAKI
jgi:hypothetical protein